MFFGTIWSLTFGRTRKEVNKPMMAIAVLLLVLSTTVSGGSLLFGRPQVLINLST